MKPISVLRAFFAIALPAAAWAQATMPIGANVVAGSATISATANSMTVTTFSQSTIINYATFNVGAGNSVHFTHPSSTSATLNRVIGGDVSRIYGSVTSNGQIFLVNPSGIYVGRGGSFSGSSVYLSTGNISNADFLGGNIRFDPPPSGSTIHMDGSIDAMDVVRFSADQVGVSGTVRSRNGSVILDGSTIRVEGLIDAADVIRFDAGSLDVTGVLNSHSGTIIANSGTGTATVAVPTLPITPPSPLTPPLMPSGGTVTINGSGTGGNLSLSGGSGAVLTTPPIVTAGSATITSTAGGMTIQNSNGAIIDWSRFNIGVNQSVNFVQPSAGSVVLNRVTGNPALILGRLASNGKVFLVNPTGILVGPGNVIPVGGMKLASASIRTPNLVAAPAPPPPPPARPLAPSLPRGTSGLVDGTVTVRLSLVDAAPISLR